jgi:hypothetical protein
VNLDLATLERQKHIITAAIANDHPVLDAQHTQGEMRQQAGDIGVVERAERETVTPDDIGRRLDATGSRIGSGIDDADVAGAAEKFEILVTCAQALIAQRLRQGIPRS